MKKLRLATVAVAGTVALAVSGCTSPTGSEDAAASSGGTIAFSNLSSQVPITTALGEQVTKLLTAEGFTVVTQDAAFDPVSQAQQLEQAANTGSIVAAWIFPVAAEMLTSSIALFQEKKIPVVVQTSPDGLGFDGPQPGVVFASADFGAYGTTIGTEAASCAVEAGAKEAILLTAPEFAGGAAAVKESLQSEYAKSAPSAPIVANAEAADLASAQTAVAQLLIANPDVSVVIAGTDETALGAVAAFAAANKTPDCIIAGGGGPDLLAAQKDGTVNVVVSWDYDAGTKDAGADLLRLLKDPTAEGAILETPISIVN